MFTPPRKNTLDHLLGGLLLIAAIGWSLLPFIAAAQNTPAAVTLARAEPIELERVVVVGHLSATSDPLACSEGVASIR